LLCRPKAGLHTIAASSAIQRIGQASLDVNEVVLKSGERLLTSRQGAILNEPLQKTSTQTF
jgi:hypothetical protein